MRATFYVLILAFVVWLIVATRSDAQEPPPPTTTAEEPPPPTRELVQGKDAAEWHGVAARYLQRSRVLRRRIRIVIHSPALPGHWLERAFACVHDGEGAWGAATGNGYYGGLQMDLSFQRTYGDWALRAFGTANRWPVSVQVATAIRAYTSGRGFNPWPNTARACGLLR